ncbi:MAG: hypothetical protein A3F83_13200 [Candidatus Glassbacteria bacterium RIFCSPLOWO2_12_FULL_58_11]|uniref:Cation/H+ exchanger domain-containing protein n=1 Tax=Candidatus Glassbacteria bacterium RIFCSPLOWO2_12_FULL_58_11 TaxID=1817867 RepID=A0A1F5YZL4_9BACT|nr:MAG: hypothetical protein A3F83_13200 [Candidatus Glassbacteria bacterium RIFCSPLOWO2_12_FULL_58_11]
MSESTRTVLLVLLVGLFALVGGRFIFGRRGRSTLFRVTSLAYLALGFILGERGWGLLSRGMLGNLEPVVGLALGWTGLLFGLQFELRRLRRYRGRFAWLTLSQSLWTILLLGAAVLLAWDHTGTAGGSRWPAILLLALAGAAGSPVETALAVSASLSVRRKFARLAHYVNSLDSLPPLILFGLTIGYFHSRAGSGMTAALEWLAAALMLGIVLGLLFNSYARHRHSENELTMMIIAFTVFSAGIAAYLSLSSLLIGTVTGVVLANLLPSSERIFRVLAARERPVLIVLLVLVGANWAPIPAGRLAPAAGLLLLILAVQPLAKLSALAFWRRWLGNELEGAGWSAGLALLGQGGMSVALVASYQIHFGAAAEPLAISLALALVVVAEALGAYAARLAVTGGEREEAE